MTRPAWDAMVNIDQFSEIKVPSSTFLGCCAISAFTRVFDALWRRTVRRGAPLSRGRNAVRRS
jgi:hypothetical protein